MKLRSQLQQVFEEAYRDYPDIEWARTFEQGPFRPPWYKRVWRRLFPKPVYLYGFGADPKDKTLMYAPGPEIAAERARRKAAGIPTLRWYKCHGCGTEYPLSDGVRYGAGCANVACFAPDIHIHSDLDGEKPETL